MNQAELFECEATEFYWQWTGREFQNEVLGPRSSGVSVWIADCVTAKTIDEARSKMKALYPGAKEIGLIKGRAVKKSQ